MIEATINGKNYSLKDNLNIISLLQELNIPQKTAVVEIDELIIEKTLWDNTIIQNKQTIEILHFVGGG